MGLKAFRDLLASRLELVPGLPAVSVTRALDDVGTSDFGFFIGSPEGEYQYNVQLPYHPTGSTMELEAIGIIPVGDLPNQEQDPGGDLLDLVEAIRGQLEADTAAGVFIPTGQPGFSVHVGRWSTDFSEEERIGWLEVFFILRV